MKFALILIVILGITATVGARKHSRRGRTTKASHTPSTAASETTSGSDEATTAFTEAPEPKSTTHEATSTATTDHATEGITATVTRRRMTTKATQLDKSSRSTAASETGLGSDEATTASTEALEPESTNVGATSTTTTAHVTVSPCEDSPKVNCVKLKPQCLDHRYDELMNEYCRKTCGRCDESIPFESACFDASKVCVHWNANGFCHNTFYTIDMKKQYCQKTCDLC